VPVEEGEEVRVVEVEGMKLRVEPMDHPATRT
jgi:membrane protein implicated in regulation of membrane protease activity